MDQITLIRYGEIALKSKQVRPRFERRLADNIRKGFREEGIRAGVDRIFGRLVVDKYNSVIQSLLKRVFGIVSFSPCWKTGSTLKDINKVVGEILPKGSESFAIRCNRVGNHDFKSKDIERDIGAFVVDKTGCKVDLTKPDKTIYIDIRNKDAFVYTEVIQGPGGIPVGSQGRVVSLVNDFNGVIASWMFLKRGCEIVAVCKNDKLLKCLKKWSIGAELENCSDLKDVGEIAALIVGDLEIKEYCYTVFRPVFGLSENQIKELEKKIKS